MMDGWMLFTRAHDFCSAVSKKGRGLHKSSPPFPSRHICSLSRFTGWRRRLSVGAGPPRGNNLEPSSSTFTRTWGPTIVSAGCGSPGWGAAIRHLAMPAGTGCWHYLRAVNGAVNCMVPLELRHGCVSCVTYSRHRSVRDFSRWV